MKGLWLAWLACSFLWLPGGLLKTAGFLTLIINLVLRSNPDFNITGLPVSPIDWSNLPPLYFGVIAMVIGVLLDKVGDTIWEKAVDERKKR